MGVIVITISHTHADGTTLDGSRKGDGVLEIVRAHGFQWRRAPGIHIPHSRDKDAQRWKIDAAAEALRAAGHDVTVEIDDTWRATAEREADRAERADGRADRYAERASKAAAVEQAHRDAEDAIGDHMPFGEPIKIGHHSERKHRRAFEKMDAHRGKAIDAADKARELARRAGAVGANLEHRADPRVTMRRIEKLEADRRTWERRSGERAARELARLSEEIAHWRAEMDAHADAGTFVPWGPEHFQKGDLVNVRGRWCTVRRVNRKSVSVPWIVGGMVTGEESTHSDTVPWDEVAGRRRDGMQLDKPNGEAWPVELARKVARWADLLRSVGRGGYDEAARRQDQYVAWAQRIAHGLDLDATASEVEAFQPHPDDTDTRRALAAAYVEVFDRLTAGERERDIRASLPAMPEVEPDWTMPEGEPQRLPVREVKPGYIIAGMWERGFAGSGERLLRGFAGPVAEVTPHEGNEYSGERFVGYWGIRLDGQEVRQFKPWQALAVFPAPAEPAAEVAAPEPTPPGEVADVVVYTANGARPGVLADDTASDRDSDAVLIRLAGEAQARPCHPRIVAGFDSAADAWHVVNAAGMVVAGGPGISRSRADEIAASPSGHLVELGPLSVVRGVPGVTCDVVGSPLPPEPVDVAYAVGRAAYSEGRPRAAGADGIVRALIDGLPVGGGAVPVFEAFARGFDAAADEAAAQVLADAPTEPQPVTVARARNPWADLLAARNAA